MVALLFNVSERTHLSFLEWSVVWPTHLLILDVVRFSIIVLGFLVLPVSGRVLPTHVLLGPSSHHTSAHTNTQTSFPFAGQGRREA